MRTYRATSGPFIERPYYTVEDVEHLCTDELQKVSLMPSDPSPIRIERFIEKKFKIHPTYEDLPEGILGLVEFGPKGVKGMAISRSLTEEGSRSSERRISTTLAHEGGHGLLHAHLFVLGQKPTSLFRDDKNSNEPKILCRKDAIQGLQGYKKTGYGGRWWEYQANLAIGPLLLPRSLVIRALEPFLEKSGLLEVKELDPACREEAVKGLARVFEVNPIVAKIRLEGLYPLARDGQLTL